MSDTLYSTLVLNLSKNPLNFAGKRDMLNSGWVSAVGKFPSCSESLTLMANHDNETFTGIFWDGVGSSVLRASASLTTEFVRGKTFDEAISFADEVFSEFSQVTPFDRDKIGDLALMSDIIKYPRRVRSAILPAHTLKLLINKIRGMNVRPK